MSTLREILRENAYKNSYYSYYPDYPDFSDDTDNNNEERSTSSLSSSSSLEDKIQNQIWDKLKNYHKHIFGDYTVLLHKKLDK